LVALEYPTPTKYDTASSAGSKWATKEQYKATVEERGRMMLNDQERAQHGFFFAPQWTVTISGYSC
jgi:hypothetical protein